MVKKRHIIITIMILFLGIYIKDYNSIYKKIARDLRVHIPRSLKFEYEDTHGGFFGDGITLAEANLNSEQINNIIKKSGTSWIKTPMPSEIRAKIYNRKLHDDKNDFSYSHTGISEIENGYWIFKDRTPEGHYSDITRNYSVGIIDLNTSILYYIKFDS